MADKTLTQLLATNPVTAALTGDEPIETVTAGTSVAAKLRQLSMAPIGINAGTTYTLGITDQGKVVTMTNASANTVTVPTNASVAFPIGASLLIRQQGGGATTIAAAGGVVINKKASLTLTLAEQYAQVVLHKTAEDTWHTTGEYVSL